MDSIKKRETKSTIKLEGREFEINSYDPLEGNYILSQIVSFVLPFGLQEMLFERVKGSEGKVAKTQTQMSKSDFISLQVDILKTVNEVYSTGNKSPVVRENGTYGIESPSMGLLLQLLIASLAFNFKDFFAEGPLSSMLDKGPISTFAATKT